jgi:phosphohistidine swiveling domain-containing protein
MDKSFDQVWIKRWAGSYTFTSCDYWGRQYYSSLCRELGAGFAHSLFTHRKGVVSFLLPQEEFRAFGLEMAKVATENPSLARERLEVLKKNTDTLVPLMEGLMQKIPSLGEYAEFLNYYDRHLPFHNFMKKTVDFLPEKEGEALLPFFKEARLYSEHVYSDTERFFRSLASTIAEKSGYSASNLTCLTQEELESYLKEKKLPPEKELLDRYECSALFFSNGKRTLFLGEEEVVPIEKQIADVLMGGEAKVKGTVAYPGHAIGTARLVLDPHNPGEFDEGDVLITGMTRPEFLSLMKKASAIVTDAGGVLSHAAISARELKKPCIVGTEVATKLFQDGQMIKVDADKGIIEILKQHK